MMYDIVASILGIITAKNKNKSMFTLGTLRQPSLPLGTRIVLAIFQFTTRFIGRSREEGLKKIKRITSP